jgi:3-dehydroquinate dehydratase-2
MSKKILIINGPNLNMLGTREPEIYGTDTIADVEERCTALAESLGMEITFYQSNYEGEIVTYIQEARERYDGLIINAGGYTHTSVAIFDALGLLDIPIVEVHISNIFQREDFRHKSMVSPQATGIVCGFGVKGYELALKSFI